MINIDELLSILFSLKYAGKDYDGKRTEFNVISDYHGERTIVRNAVEGWWKDQEARGRIREAELEAKCYAYEQIIAKSNFKPLLETKASEE